MDIINMQNQDLQKFYETIGENVAKYRKEKGLSQLELAQAIGHKSTTIISLGELAKKKHFNLEHLFRISIYLEVDINNFLN